MKSKSNPQKGSRSHRTELRCVVLILSFLNCVANPVSGNINKAPLVMTVEVGPRLLTHISYSNVGQILPSVLFEFGWQLSGFEKGFPVSLNIPIEASYASPVTGIRSMFILSYGWTIRHELAPVGHKWVPFIGYGLLLNQLFLGDTPGNVIGHETRFDLGMDLKLKNRMAVFLKVEYSMLTFPSFGKAKADTAGVFSVKTGFRF